MENDFTKYLLAASKELQQPKSEVSDIKEEIFVIEKSITDLELQLETRGIQSSHLVSYQKVIDSLLRQIDEITKTLDNVHSERKELAARSQVASFYARDSQLHSNGNGVPGLESPCMRSVRETCELISSYFMREYYTNSGLEIDGGKDISKDELWSLAEEIAHSFSPKEIKAGMVSNIQESTANLNDLCSRIDLKRDADNLKFMFETGKLKDVSTKPIIMQTVQQLIEEGQVSHFKRFLESEKSKNRSFKLQKELDEINSKISQKLLGKFDSKEATRIKEIMLLEQEEKMLDESIQHLQEGLVKLKCERAEKEKSMEHLHLKYNCIQNFDKTVQGKQLVIQRLIKNNGNAKARHRQQHQDIVATTEQKIIKCKSELPEVCHRFRDSRNEEIDVYMKTPLANLQTVKSITERRQLVSDLSIHRLDSKYKPAGGEHLNSVCKSLSIPAHAPPERILPTVLERVDEVYKKEEVLNKDNTDDLSAAVSMVQGIKDKVFRSNEEDINASLPTLNESQKKSHNILSECIKFQNTVQQWWEQPAQHSVPWLKEDGKNLSQYIDHFSSNAELIRKIQSVN